MPTFTALPVPDRRRLLAHGIDIDQLEARLSATHGRPFTAVGTDLGFLQSYVIVTDSDGRRFRVDADGNAMVEIHDPAPRFSLSRRR